MLKALTHLVDPLFPTLPCDQGSWAVSTTSQNPIASGLWLIQSMGEVNMETASKRTQGTRSPSCLPGVLRTRQSNFPPLQATAPAQLASQSYWSSESLCVLVNSACCTLWASNKHSLLLSLASCCTYHKGFLKCHLYRPRKNWGEGQKRANEILTIVRSDNIHRVKKT